MLLHVSILRSFSGRTFCSLLKLYVKNLIILLNISVMQQHIVCMFICCMCYREVGRSTDFPATHKYIHIHTIWCRITETFNKIIKFLTYNFSKEQNVLRENDLVCNKLQTTVIYLSFLRCIYQTTTPRFRSESLRLISISILSLSLIKHY